MFQKRKGDVVCTAPRKFDPKNRYFIDRDSDKYDTIALKTTMVIIKRWWLV